MILPSSLDFYEVETRKIPRAMQAKKASGFFLGMILLE
jgi:hypothetical protein